MISASLVGMMKTKLYAYVTFSHPSNVTMNRTALCCGISKDSMSLASNGFHTVSAYSKLVQARSLAD